MAWTPRLNVTCSRCGKPRGVTHVCYSNSTRKAKLKPGVSFGQCAKCRKRISNPLTHTCRPPSDFKRRRRAQEKTDRQARRKTAAKKATATRKQNTHDYQTCRDADCKRSACVAYKTGYQTGDRDGYERGFQLGWDRGFPAGQAACPLEHK